MGVIIVGDYTEYHTTDAKRPDTINVYRVVKGSRSTIIGSVRKFAKTNGDKGFIVEYMRQIINSRALTHASGLNDIINVDYESKFHDLHVARMITCPNSCEKTVLNGKVVPQYHNEQLLCFNCNNCGVTVNP